jgi:hypothetical protein
MRTAPAGYFSAEDQTQIFTGGVSIRSEVPVGVDQNDLRPVPSHSQASLPRKRSRVRYVSPQVASRRYRRCTTPSGTVYRILPSFTAPTAEYSIDDRVGDFHYYDRHQIRTGKGRKVTDAAQEITLKATSAEKAVAPGPWKLPRSFRHFFADESFRFSVCGQEFPPGKMFRRQPVRMLAPRLTDQLAACIWRFCHENRAPTSPTQSGEAMAGK